MIMHSPSLSLFARGDVEVEQGLEVVSQELDRDNYDSLNFLGMELSNDVVEVGFEPGLRGVAGGLVTIMPLLWCKIGSDDERIDSSPELV